MRKATLAALLGLLAVPLAADSGRWPGPFVPPQTLDLVPAPPPEAPAPPAAETAAAFQYGLLPQAGIVGRDIYVYNYVDLDPLPGDAAILDWDCSRYTYDGHGGHDIIIRGFREQAIGVPIYAAFPGVVFAAVDQHPDDSIDWNPKPANVVVIDHEGGYRTYYYHLRRGSALVAPGDAVVAGQQIASVASSGISTGPHLHFETRRDGVVVEPSAGPCRAGERLWVDQEPVSRTVYVREAYFAAAPYPVSIDPEVSWRAILEDQRPRLRGVVKGTQKIYLWLELFNLPGSSRGRVRVLDPKGALRFELFDSFGPTEFLRAADFDLPIETTFDPVGEWRILVDVVSGATATTVLDTELRVVATAKAARNRPPAKVAVELGAPKADASRPTLCSIQTALVARDPDHDLVSYRLEGTPRRRPGHHGVGLANTSARLRTLFGDEARVELAAQPAGGAIVRLGFPRREGARA